jgi:hypothetical protein
VVHYEVVVITWEQLIGLNLKDLQAYMADRETRVLNLTGQNPFKVLTPPNSLRLSRLFDETNAAIGEDWVWNSDTYYFARESDAVWFATRWL